MKAAQQFAQGIAGIDGLEVVGEPVMTVVAFKASRRQASRSPTAHRLCVAAYLWETRLCAGLPALGSGKQAGPALLP